MAKKKPTIRRGNPHDWRKLLMRDFQDGALRLDRSIFNVHATNMSVGARIATLHDEPQYIGSMVTFLEKQIGVEEVTLRRRGPDAFA